MGLRRRGDHWLWVGGPVPPGADAITIWSVISVRRRAAGSDRLLAHEEEHVRQWRRLGPVGFLRQYLGAYVVARMKGFGHTAAYRLIPLEIEAEDAAHRYVADAGSAVPASAVPVDAVLAEQASELPDRPQQLSANDADPSGST